jgi:hypothetical protein
MPDFDPEEIHRVAKAVRERAFLDYIKRQREIKTQGAFEYHVWNYMREYFTSTANDAAFTFLDQMIAEVDNQYHRAWNEGAHSVDVLPADMTDMDMMVLQVEIGGEQNLLGGIAGDIERAKADGLTDAEFHSAFRNRAFMWSNRYNAVADKAATYFGQRAKFEWVLGGTENHCHTGDEGKPGIGCANLAGIVMWGHEWDVADIKPQQTTLVCGGYNCECRLEPTDKPRTRGGLGRVLDMRVAASL